MNKTKISIFTLLLIVITPLIKPYDEFQLRESGKRFYTEMTYLINSYPGCAHYIYDKTRWQEEAKALLSFHDERGDLAQEGDACIEFTEQQKKDAFFCGTPKPTPTTMVQKIQHAIAPKKDLLAIAAKARERTLKQDMSSTYLLDLLINELQIRNKKWDEFIKTSEKSEFVKLRK